jgi:hypothetical protein
MGEPSQPKRVCRACGAENEAGAVRCASCGQELDEDPELIHVDPDRRVELTRFDAERGDEAELACGLLRANGIACELSSTALPGLPADLIVWVNPQDAGPAWALLDDVQRGVPGEQEEDDETA